MNWLSIRSWDYKIQARECWHLWFAWFPVVTKRFPDGAVERSWLCTVKRMGYCSWLCWLGWNYIYRPYKSKGGLK